MNRERINQDQYEQKYGPEPDLLQSILDNAVLEDMAFEEPFSHNVTSMSKCLRQRWYKWFDIKKILKEPPESYQSWGWMGNVIETHLIDLAKMAGIYRAEQVRVKQSNPNISGAIDLIVQFPGDDRFYPVEIKSSKTEAFFDNTEFVCPACHGKMYKTAKFCKLCGSEVNPIKRILWPGAESKISFDYYCQLQMYLYLVSNSGKIVDGQPILFEEGFLWYYNKNTGDQVLHRVLYDDYIINWLLARTVEFETHLKNNEIPPRMFDAHITRFGIGTKSDWHCRFCDYKYNCYEEEILKTNPRFFEPEVK